MLRPSPNHGTQRLPNDDNDDDYYYDIVLGRKWQPLPVLKYRGLVTLCIVCEPAMNNSITNRLAGRRA